MSPLHYQKYLFLPLLLTTYIAGCSSFKKEKKSSFSIYKGSCKHTQTFSSVVVRNDSTIYFNAGVFLADVHFYGDCEIIGDTINITWSEKDKKSLGHRLENGLLIMENGLKELGDSSIHRHFFRFHWDKQDL